MMFTIAARNVNDALVYGASLVMQAGVKRDSRNGPVISLPAPAMTTYLHPDERVLFEPKRNANPFFHLIEGLWMIAGRNDVAAVAAFVKRMATFSDDGERLHGAYGYRWRKWFGYDQISVAIDELRRNPKSRRVVVAMWDAYGASVEGNPTAMNDLQIGTNGGKDVPCNTHIYLTAASGRLDMTVCCRSNDAIWGAYGANAVHMSMLQEYIAAHAGLPLGRYYQMSNDLHIYTDVHKDVAFTLDDRYADERAVITPLVRENEDPRAFDEDLSLFMRWLDVVIARKKFTSHHWYTTKTFKEVIRPMANAWFTHKFSGSHIDALRLLHEGDTQRDWIQAGHMWLDNHYASKEKAQ